MKFAIHILKASVWILLVFLGLYFSFFCMDDGVIDPLETELIAWVVFVALGIGLSLFLTRRKKPFSPIVFWISFVFYLLTFTLPALVTSCIVILYMTAG